MNKHLVNTLLLLFILIAVFSTMGFAADGPDGAIRFIPYFLALVLSIAAIIYGFINTVRRSAGYLWSVAFTVGAVYFVFISLFSIALIFTHALKGIG